MFGSEIWGPLIGHGIDKQVDIQQSKSVRSWLGKQSDTAVRRRMADLKAAGMNPLLAAWEGATVPGAPLASGGGAGSALASGFATSVALKRARAEVKQTGQSIESVDMDLLMKRNMMDYYKRHPDIRDMVSRMQLLKIAGHHIPEIGMFATGARELARVMKVFAEQLGVWRLRSKWPNGFKLPWLPDERNVLGSPDWVERNMMKRKD